MSIEIYQKDGLKLPYKIIRKSIKHSYFRIRDGVVVITTNRRTNKDVLFEMLEEKFAYFYTRVINQQNQINNNKVTLFTHQYDVIEINSSKFSYEIDGTTIKIYHNNKKPVEKLLFEIKKKLLDQKINELNKIVISRLELVNLSIVPHQIKDVKSYYGKCYFTRKEIFYNVKLVEFDDELILYIMFHEYAHLLVPNHSKEFHKVLRMLMPNYKNVEKRLKKVT